MQVVTNMYNLFVIMFLIVRFTLVGQNPVASTLTDRIRTIHIPADEQIEVEVNDFLGVSFPKNDAGSVAFEFCELAYEPDRGMQLRSSEEKKDYSKWKVGKEYEFVAMSPGCITWSLNAFI